ncbi:MAG: PEP-CTERM sorting domain-containing protein [Planctomycetaceae bacterium]
MFRSITVLTVIILLAPPVVEADLLYFSDNESAFQSQVQANHTGGDTILQLDDGSGIFGAAPTAGTGLASVIRTGTTSSGSSFSFEISDVNFKTGQPYTMDAGVLSVGNDILSTSTLGVESSVSQGGASSPNWGVDSFSAPDLATSPNAAVFDFTGSATAVNHFGVTMHDFEGGFANGTDGIPQSAFVRIYDASNNLIDSQALNFSSPDFGDGESIHFGVFASNGMTLSKVVLIVGDDNDSDATNGWGLREGWAASDFTVGFASTPEPGSLSLLCIAGVACVFQRRRRPTR